MIYFITGGTRSGKSSFAQKLALTLSENPVYVATARKWDGDFQKRIERHQQDRNENWTTYEEEKYVSKLDLRNKVVVIDCVTLWLTNFFTDLDDVDQALQEFKRETDVLKEVDATFIIISNELGMGLHADTEIGRRFTDLQGWVNQYIAQCADTAVFMVSGLPMVLKGKLTNNL